MIDFSDLAIDHCNSWQPLLAAKPPIVYDTATVNTAWLKQYKQHWRTIYSSHDDRLLSDWLIAVFNACFAAQNTILVRGGDEPEYLPASNTRPAMIVFARGFFASGLHEISHWCIAGRHRRSLVDFGYWYCPDGRDEATQAAFEQVEIRPQAIECLLTLATGRRFYTSADNLNANFDTSASTFAQDVHAQAQAYLTDPTTLPKDAQKFLALLLHLCQDNH